MTTVTFTRHGREFSLDTEEIEGRDYLLQYGMSQSCQDAIAGVSTKVWEELAERAMKDQGILASDKTDPFREFIVFLKKDDSKEYRDTFNALHKAETVKTELALLEKRVAAIESGTVGTRGGSSDDPVWTEMKRLGRTMLPAWLKARGFKVPKDRDVYNETLEAFLNGAEGKAVRTIAEDNVKNQEALRKLVNG